MIRTLIAVALALVGLAAPRLARAQVAAPAAVQPPAAAQGQAQATDQGADDSDTAGPLPCSPEIAARLRAQLPAASSLRCHFKAGESKTVNGVVEAGAVELYRADIAFGDGRTARARTGKDGAIIAMTYTHDDLSGSSGRGMALVFWAFAVISVVGAIFVISRRNLIAAAMGMVGSFLGIAAIYMLLYAQFLAIVQMLVYAGAIMVLFVFVVMILNRPEDEPVAPSGRIGQAVGGVAILYLVARLIVVLIHVEPPNLKIANEAPPAVVLAHGRDEAPQIYDWGSVRAVGTDLFTGGLFPFEAISILLLLAVVGAIAIARPMHADDDAPAKIRLEGGAP